LIPLEEPNVRSSEESKSHISPDIQGHDSEAKSQRQAREKRNRLKEGRRCCAQQRKEAWERYEIDLAEYNRKRLEWEIEDRRMTGRTRNSPYDKIQEMAEELEAISHPDEEQEHLKEILRSTAQRMQGGRTNSKQPIRTDSHREDSQSQ
jgi:hypothetical protein